MALTDAKVRTSAPAAKRYELTDGNGLSVVILPSGSKVWRLRYRTQTGGRKRVGLGVYPDVSLAKARAEASKLRARVFSGEDPAADLAAKRIQGDTVADVVGLYLAENQSVWKESTARTYTSAINTFLAWARSSRVKLASDVTPAALARYRAHAASLPRRAKARGGSRREVVTTGDRRSAAAVNCDLRATKTMLQALRKSGRLPAIESSDAIRDNLELLAVEQTRAEPLRPAQLRDLLAACKRHDAQTWTITREELRQSIPAGTTPKYEPIGPLVALMLLSGMRLGEALALTWQDIDLDDQAIRVLPAKTGRERAVDLGVSPALVQMLSVLERTGPRLFRHTQQTALDARHRLISEYGAPDFLWSTRNSRAGERSAPTLRSTCGCYLTNAPAIFGAASVYRSSAQLGHSVQVAERHYLGTLRRIPADATTLESAMGIAAEIDDLINASRGVPLKR